MRPRECGQFRVSDVFRAATRIIDPFISCGIEQWKVFPYNLASPLADVLQDVADLEVAQALDEPGA